MSGKVILTVSEVSEYLQVSKATVYKMARTREIPATQIGRSWRFRWDLIDDWLIECSNDLAQEVAAQGEEG
jgi:excisionase family DNA binding protein